MVDADLVYFNDRHAKYLCCCNRFHSRRAVGTLCVAEFVWCLLLLLVNIVFYSLYQEARYRGGVAYLALAVVLAALCIGAELAVLLGVRYDKCEYLLPHLAVSALVAIALAIYLITIIISIIIISGTSSPVHAGESNTAQSRWLSANLVLVVPAIVFQCWFVSVIFACYTYIRDKRAHLSLIAEPRVYYGATDNH